MKLEVALLPFRKATDVAAFRDRHTHPFERIRIHHGGHEQSPILLADLGKAEGSMSARVIQTMSPGLSLFTALQLSTSLLEDAFVMPTQKLLTRPLSRYVRQYFKELSVMRVVLATVLEFLTNPLADLYSVVRRDGQIAAIE